MPGLTPLKSSLLDLRRYQIFIVSNQRIGFPNKGFDARNTLRASSVYRGYVTSYIQMATTEIDKI